MKDFPKVAIVVVHYGSPDITLECLKSLYKTRYKNKYLILIDNNPEQRIFKKPINLKNEFSYVQNVKNIGYCGGNNKGIAKAIENEAKYIFILNNDTVVDENIIGECVKYMENHPDVQVLSPKILFFHKPQIINSAGGRLDLNTGQIEFFKTGQRDNEQFDGEKEISFIHGCAFFSRSSLFQKIGMFDENYFCYGEDVDFSYRIIRSGIRAIYYPQAKIWHKNIETKIDGETSLLSASSNYYFWRNRLYNLRRYNRKFLLKAYILYGYDFFWAFMSFALKHKRIDLCVSMLIGLFDSLFFRMGRRDYILLKFIKKTGNFSHS